MGIVTAILNTVIVLICLFMICLILIQRGKGGGLAGAFGGVGGSSAFGTKSGDVFTKVTMITATVWIVLSMINVVLHNTGGQSAWGSNDTSVSKEVSPKSTKDKAKTVAPLSTKLAPASSSPSTSPAPAETSPSVPAVPAIPEPSEKK